MLAPDRDKSCTPQSPPCRGERSLQLCSERLQGARRTGWRRPRRCPEKNTEGREDKYYLDFPVKDTQVEP